MTDHTTWPTIEAFYDDDPRRRHSGECDYGLWWTEPEADFPRYRVSYIEVTGEVYSVALKAGKYGTVSLLAVVPPDTGRCYYETLDALLDGWGEHCGPGGLSWVRERLAGWVTHVVLGTGRHFRSRQVDRGVEVRGIELWNGRDKSIETWARATGLSIAEVRFIADLPAEKWPAIAYLAVCLQAAGRQDHSVTAVAQGLCAATGGHRTETLK